jgi:hypothetical protein
MKKPQSPERKAAQSEQKRINKLFFDALGENGAFEVVEDLERHFELKSMLKRAPDGVIDVYATIANNGAYEVLSWIKQRIENGSLAR